MDEATPNPDNLDEAAEAARAEAYAFKLRAIADIATESPPCANLLLDEWATRWASEVTRLGPVRSATPGPRSLTPKPEPRVAQAPREKDESWTPEEPAPAAQEGASADSPPEQPPPRSFLREMRARRTTTSS